MAAIVYSELRGERAPGLVARAIAEDLNTVIEIFGQAGGGTKQKLESLARQMQPAPADSEGRVFVARIWVRDNEVRRTHLGNHVALYFEAPPQLLLNLRSRGDDSLICCP